MTGINLAAPLQVVARAAENLAITYDELETTFAKARETATTTEDVMAAAIGEAHAAGGKAAAELLALMVFRAIANTEQEEAA